MFAEVICLLATVLAVGIFWALHRRKELPAATPVSKKAKRAVAKKGGGSAADRAGTVRQCKFCEVVVTEEQTQAHLAGKKHKKCAGDATDCWEWVRKAHEETESPGQSNVASAAVSSASEAVAESSGGWASVKRPARRRKGGPVCSEAIDTSSLPTLGFALVGGVEPILPLIRSGHKTIELRRRGSKLSDGSVLDRCQVGDRFVGEPLAARLRYTAVLEVTGPIAHHASHGAAWEVYGERVVPRALGPLRSAAEAQRFYEKCFYEGRVLQDAPVITIPVRMVAWLEDGKGGR